MRVFLVMVFLISSNLIGYCVSECPNGINAYGMTEQSRIDVLFWHKKYRNEVVEGVVPNVPRAAKMPEMIYEAELETEAQYFANHCHFEYETITTKTWGVVGVNLFMQVRDRFDRRQEWAQVIYEWWQQHDMYLFWRGANPQSRNFGQMIWAESKHIGCGFTIFPIKHPNLTLFHKFYVCAYAPKGNVPGKLPFKKIPNRDV